MSKPPFPKLTIVLAMLVAAAPLAANTLAVNNVDPIAGNFDLELTLTGDSTAAYVETNSPDAETGIRIEFDLKVTDLNMGGGAGEVRNVRIAKGLSTFPAPPGGVGAEHLVVFLKRPFNGSTNYRIRVMTGLDAGFFGTCAEGFFAIPNVIKRVTIEWVAASSEFGGDGRCSVFLTPQGGSQTLLGQQTTLNSGKYNIDRVRMGVFQPTHPTDGSGSYEVDNVVLTRIN